MPIFNTEQEALQYSVDLREFEELKTKLYEKYGYDAKSERVYNKTHIIKKVYTHLFLTINPPPKMRLNDFINKIYKTLSKNWIEGYLFVIEQRGENIEEIGKGFHTHILIKILGQKKQSEITREIKNTWKKELDIDNYHILNIKYIDDDEQIRKQNYILGTKTETHKHLKQKHDIIYRNENKLEKYYFLNYNIEDIYKDAL